MARQAYGIEIGGELYDFVSSGVTSGEVVTLIEAAVSGKADSSDVYSIDEVDALLDEKLDISTFNIYSGVVASEMVNKAENSDLEALEGTFSAFSATVAAEIQELEASGMTSGAVQDMLTAYTYSKQEIEDADAQKLDITAFSAYSGIVASELSEMALESDLNALEGTVSAHTANTDIHVTAADKTAWSNKQDALTAGDNIIISGNVISTTVQYWCGDESQWASISGSTDPNTIYMVHE